MPPAGGWTPLRLRVVVAVWPRESVAVKVKVFCPGATVTRVKKLPAPSSASTGRPLRVTGADAFPETSTLVPGGNAVPLDGERTLIAGGAMPNLLTNASLLPESAPWRGRAVGKFAELVLPTT
jgi:hypothetical protein